jgi:hypothetical protein
MDWTTYNKSQEENPIINDWAVKNLSDKELSEKHKKSAAAIKKIQDEVLRKTQFPLKLDSNAFVVKFHNPTFAKAMEKLGLKTFEDLLKYPFKDLAKNQGFGPTTLWRLLVKANELGVQPNTEGYRPR